MTTTLVELKNTFLAIIDRNIIEDLPPPVSSTKAVSRVELDSKQINLLQADAEVHVEALKEDGASKLVIANARRLVDSGQATLNAALDKLPAAKAKKPRKKADTWKKEPARVRMIDESVEVADSPSAAMYDTLNHAFTHFNKELFDGNLPPVIIVVHRKRNAHGYFWEGQWQHRDDAERKLSEIALNPQTMGRDIKTVLSTFVHEMVHHAQHVHGNPGKVAHNQEWAEMMDEVGLTPTSTGKEGGKRTGRSVTHMIVDGGPFDVSCDAFLKRNDVDVSWFSPPQAGTKKRDRSKVKHTCACCGTNIWGKEGITVFCCDEMMEEA
jgi:predicted SprT family Zn-dependent metalloprotease